MGLKLRELQKVVKNVVREEKNAEILREEIVRVLGPTILVPHNLEKMAENVNDRLDVLEATGRICEQIRPSLLLKFIDSDSSEVRKLVARLIPENFLKMLMKDSDHSVRASVARRLSRSLVKEMIHRFPNDDILLDIERSKRLQEAGLPTLDIKDEEFDMYGEMSMGEMIEDVEHPGLTDAWYSITANKIVNLYGGNLEGQWEEIAVKRYCDSVSSMGLDVDHDKLLDAVYDLLEEREEKALGESSLKDLAARLRFETTEMMPIISETTDLVQDLISSGLTAGGAYMEKFEEVFSVQYTTSANPARIRGITEGSDKITHPFTATLPNNYTRAVDERALDAYAKSWNNREQLRGEAPYKLIWTPDLEVGNLVNFYLELK